MARTSKIKNSRTSVPDAAPFFSGVNDSGEVSTGTRRPQNFERGDDPERVCLMSGVADFGCRLGTP